MTSGTLLARFSATRGRRHTAGDCVDVRCRPGELSWPCPVPCSSPAIQMVRELSASGADEEKSRIRPDATQPPIAELTAAVASGIDRLALPPLLPSGTVAATTHLTPMLDPNSHRNVQLGVGRGTIRCMRDCRRFGASRGRSCYCQRQQVRRCQRQRHRLETPRRIARHGYWRRSVRRGESHAASPRVYRKAL
jgi:hypothetical protein